MNRANRPRISRVSGSSYASRLLGRAGDGSTLSLDFTTGVLDPRLTFTRTSDATFINSSGLVQYADANYLAQSETLSGSPWSTNNVSNTSVAVTNPVGGPDSRLITVTTGGSAAIFASFSIAAGFQYTLRIWMRAGNSTSASFGVFSGGFLNATPSVVSGPGSVSGTSLCSVTGLSSTAWTQIQLVLAVTAVSGTTFAYFYPRTTSNTTGDSIHLWGAQFNIGNTADPYYPTTTSAYQAPRFDYDPTAIGTPRGLLIEGSANNLCTYSGDMTQSGSPHWTQRVNLDTSAWTGFTAPDGTATAVKLIPNTTNGLHNIQNVNGSLTLVAYTASAFVKADGRTVVGLAIGGSQAWQNFVLTGNGSLGSASTSPAPTSTITPVGSTGWYRVTMTWTSTLSAVGVQLYVTLPQTSSTSPFSAYAGDGTQNGVQAWGYQLELGSGASSYIPTGASTGNRAADNCYIYDTTSSGGLSWFKTATQGTFYVEMFKRTAGTAFAAAGFGTRGNSFEDFMLYQAVGNNWLSFNWGAGEYVTNYSALSSPFLIKAAVALSPSTPTTEADSTVSINGSNSALNTGPNIALPFTSDLFCIGSRGAAAGTSPSQNYAETAIKRIKFFPFAMTAAQMNAMTTL